MMATGGLKLIKKSNEILKEQNIIGVFSLHDLHDYTVNQYYQPLR